MLGYYTTVTVKDISATGIAYDAYEWSLLRPDGYYLDVEFFNSDKTMNVDVRDESDILKRQRINHNLQLQLIRTLFRVETFYFEQ